VSLNSLLALKEFRMNYPCQLFKTVYKARSGAVKNSRVQAMNTLIFDCGNVGPEIPFRFHTLKGVGLYHGSNDDDFRREF
jgi:hypothetical protein